MTVQEFEVWWAAGELGVSRWNDEDIDWNTFWVSFATDGGSIFITASEFIVRQQPDQGGAGGVVTEVVYKTASLELPPPHGNINRLSGVTFFGDPFVGVSRIIDAGQFIIYDAWLLFMPGAGLVGGGVNPPAIPKGSIILDARLEGLERTDQNLIASGYRTDDVPAFIQGNIAQSQFGFPDQLPGKTSAVSIWWIPIHPDTDPGYPPGEMNVPIGFPHIIQEIIDDPQWQDDGSWPIILMVRSQHAGSVAIDLEDRNQHLASWQSGLSPFHDMATLIISYGTKPKPPDPPSESCLQACECLCQSTVESGGTGCTTTCEQNCQTATEITTCQGQCQVQTEGTFSLPPNQDGITCFQYEREGCFEINACLGNTIKFTDAMTLLDAYFRDQRPIHVLPVYCLTIADLPEVASCAGDDFFVRVIAKLIDAANTPSHDDLVIIPDCTQGCMVSCETFCEVGCEDNCQGIGPCENSCQLNCEANCQTDCEVVCQQGCVISCQNDACQSFCQSACEEVCQISCEDVCQGACEIAGCQLSCTDGCEDFCQFDCQNACEFDCQSPAEVACQTSCQEFCETCCQDACEGVGCQTTCEQICQASCVSGCETACETNCQTACEGGCQAVCEFNCQDGCEGVGCELSCEGGCQGGCQGSCEVVCEGATCQMACEGSGCQSCCECQCQSEGCEGSCTTGCTEGCQMGCESECQDAGGCETGCEMSCEGSSEACTDCCEVCCEEYTEYGCSLGSCEATCTADNCQSACMATAQG